MNKSVSSGMRQMLKDTEVGLDPRFRYRGKNQTRVETFSDAAFALAITLLVLSSTVPETFEELRASMRSIVPFGMCVALITVIWYQHYIFFLKFGLQDNTTVTINTILIFLILIYVYPLKFLSRFLFELWLAAFTGDLSMMRGSFGAFDIENTQFLMVVYGLGAASIFLVLAWMHRYALKKRDQLELDDYECFATSSGMISNLLMASIPIISVCLSFFEPILGKPFIVAGFSYFLYPPVMFLFGYIRGKREKRLFGAL